MIEIVMAVGISGAALGTIAGLVIGSREIDRECEKAYLTGHVDGYEKALFDLGEV